MTLLFVTLQVLLNHCRPSHGSYHVWHLYPIATILDKYFAAIRNILIKIRSIYKIYKVIDFVDVSGIVPGLCKLAWECACFISQIDNMLLGRWIFQPVHGVSISLKSKYLPPKISGFRVLVSAHEDYNIIRDWAYTLLFSTVTIDWNSSRSSSCSVRLAIVSIAVLKQKLKVGIYLVALCFDSQGRKLKTNERTKKQTLSKTHLWGSTCC